MESKMKTKKIEMSKLDEVKKYCFYSKDQVDINHFGDADIFVHIEDYEQLANDYDRLFFFNEETRSDNTAHFRKIMELQKELNTKGEEWRKVVEPLVEKYRDLMDEVKYSMSDDIYLYEYIKALEDYEKRMKE